MARTDFPRKFVLQQRITYPHQRSGWAYAVTALEPLLSHEGNGVLLDTMIEKNFCRRLAEARRNKEIPYRRPWVGFVHVTLNIPRWHEYRKSLRYVSRLRVWRESFPHCRGLITLSARVQRQLQEWLNVPVLHLKHPTQTPELKFSIERYRANTKKRVIQVGWWLRRLCSIGSLPVRGLRRTMLEPFMDSTNTRRYYDAIERERLRLGAPPVREWDVDMIPHQPPDEYDRLLSENIVFLHLYTASANNAIIECIVRNTPVLVNPLPPVMEYLGEEYPFYFRTLEEAAAKAEDMTQVRQAHEYLAALPKESLSGEYFCRSLAESEFYRNL